MKGKIRKTCAKHAVGLWARRGCVITPPSSFGFQMNWRVSKNLDRLNLARTIEVDPQESPPAFSMVHVG